MPQKKKSNACLYAIIALLFLGGVGFLIYQGLSENSTYFLDVTEAKAQDQSKLTNIRLFGTVASEGIVRPEQGLGVSFTLEDQFDKSETLPVRYTGVVPDTFKEGAEVIVEGGFAGNGQFQAKVLMTKCPSKYQKENRS
ncbi:MAG: cytochrome c maturation protein CcmE [Desulfovibrionaceae bacterium]|nr:cytochrome c maturation protein CcmE [Desulfovibrionaceae bacterium]